MTNSALQLHAEITRLERDLTGAKGELAHMQRTCQHDWPTPTYDPIMKEGYRDPGDTQGTMGVDFRGPQWIPGSTTKRWRRTCPKCRLTQETQRTKKVPTSGSIPGTSGTQEVPDFG